jgi:hypothetical protein
MGAGSLDKADDAWWADSVHHGNDKQTLRPLRRAYEEVVAANLALPIGVPTPVSMILLPLCAHVCVVSVCLCISLSMCVCVRACACVCACRCVPYFCIPPSRYKSWRSLTRTS